MHLPLAKADHRGTDSNRLRWEYIIPPEKAAEFHCWILAPGGNRIRHRRWLCLAPRWHGAWRLDVGEILRLRSLDFQVGLSAEPHMLSLLIKDLERETRVSRAFPTQPIPVSLPTGGR
jgi:hypothetical protein